MYICFLEMIPVILGTEICGLQLRNKNCRVNIDNFALVSIINKLNLAHIMYRHSLVDCKVLHFSHRFHYKIQNLEDVTKNFGCLIAERRRKTLKFVLLQAANHTLDFNMVYVCVI